MKKINKFYSFFFSLKHCGYFQLRYFGHWNISVICPTVVLKFVIKVFLAYIFKHCDRNDLLFFGNEKNVSVFNQNRPKKWLKKKQISLPLTKSVMSFALMDEYLSVSVPLLVHWHTDIFLSAISCCVKRDRFSALVFLQWNFLCFLNLCIYYIYNACYILVLKIQANREITFELCTFFINVFCQAQAFPKWKVQLVVAWNTMFLYSVFCNERLNGCSS